jgi:hypothetical protein
LMPIQCPESRRIFILATGLNASLDTSLQSTINDPSRDNIVFKTQKCGKYFERILTRAHEQKPSLL